MCTPQSPNCGSCPLQKQCAAYKNGTVDQIPNRGPKQEKISIKVAIVVIKDPINANKFFIQKREHGGLMGGLWEFPGGKCEKDETPDQALRREVKEELGITLKNIQPITQIKHAYTKFIVDLHCFRAEQGKGTLLPKAASDYKWVGLDELANFPFPAANVKLIERLCIDSNNQQ